MNNQETEYVKIITGQCLHEINDPPIIFPYKCDDFQKHAFNCINNDENLLATAHTGSGKTTIAEYAIAYTINIKKKNVVYTSPIKSLSNEKYSDFSKKFMNNPNISLGILTGDNKINPDGNCIIMTAEILRNALYKLKSNNDDDDIKHGFIDKIGCVIMDEVHFINDPDRGKVWEETIVLLDKDIQLILLSATISYPERFAKWIGQIKKRNINLISTTYRAVPLNHYIYIGNGKLIKIFDQNDNYDHNNYVIASREYTKIQKNRQKKHKSLIDINLIQDMIMYLQKNDMLQAIFFSFSKKNCEYYAETIMISLVNHEEIKKIELLFDKYMHKYKKQYEMLDQYKTVKKLLTKGIAFHHSGLLPILKEIIEIIFHEGLLKVLFATETFAVGVNMPTRTVIFTELEKFTDQQRRLLNTGEYKQMSGRAGRRGIDIKGNVIILPIYNLPDDQTLRILLTGKVPSIESQFKIDYQFYLKTLQSCSTDIITFLDNSLYLSEYKKDIIIMEDKLKKMDFHEDEIDDKIKELYNLQEINMIMSKNQNKKYHTLNLEINNNLQQRALYKKYCEYMQITKRYQDIKNDNFNKILDKIKYVLKSFNFITDDNTILKKGIIAIQINECNALLLTEMIVKGFFKQLSPEEIVALLAIFIEERKDEDNYLTDIHTTSRIRTLLQDITYIIQNYTDLEYQIGIQDNENYWSISYDFINIAYQWMIKDDKILDTIKGIYLGTFIRNMIKINNIVKNLIYLFNIDGDNEVIPILEKIEPLIMRDFVSINSLYLTN